MSRNGTLLPLPDSPTVEFMLGPDGWPGRFTSRSKWLGAFEGLLRAYYPRASSADLRLTARSVAPFPLAAGHNVP